MKIEDSIPQPQYIGKTIFKDTMERYEELEQYLRVADPDAKESAKMRQTSRRETSK